jgi:hypothetical protein
MKVNLLACALLVLLATAIQLPAQQPVSPSGTNATTTNKTRLLPDFCETNVDFVPDNPVEVLKVRAEKGDADSQDTDQSVG